MIRLGSLLFLALTFSVCFGQNIGYHGKKNAVGVGLRLNNYNVPEKTHPEPQIFIERSVTSLSSIVIKSSLQHANLRYDNNEVYINGLRYVLIEDVFADASLNIAKPMSGPIESRIVSTSLSFRTYALGMGAIAPMGPFYEVGFTGNMVNITDTKARVSGTFNQGVFAADLIYAPRYAKNFDFGFHARCGEKVFIGKSQFIEYSLGVSLDGMTVEKRSFNTHMKAAHYIIKRQYLMKSFIHFNLIYGFGF